MTPSLMMRMGSRVLITIAVVLGLPSISLLTSGRSHAQVGPSMPGFKCHYIGGLRCDECSDILQPPFGCTAPPPYAWRTGICKRAPSVCTEWLDYDCGLELECGTGNPTGFNCNTSVILCMGI